MSLRLLLIGDSGTGKTGALLPLLKNYKLRIADFDNGVDFLKMNSSAELRQNLSVKTFTDEFSRSTISGLTLNTPTAITRFGNALDKWDEAGPFKTWGPDTILVIDSLTFLGRAMARHFLDLNKKKPDSVIEPRQFGAIQGMIFSLMDQLLDDAKSCHYIVISHIDYRDYQEGSYAPVGMMDQGDKPDQIPKSQVEAKGVPTVFGAKLGPQIGRYFNFMLRARISTIGNMRPRRIIQTQPDQTIDLKCPILELEEKGELPLSSGLATLFAEWEKRNN